METKKILAMEVLEKFERDYEKLYEKIQKTHEAAKLATESIQVLYDAGIVEPTSMQDLMITNLCHDLDNACLDVDYIHCNVERAIRMLRSAVIHEVLPTDNNMDKILKNKDQTRKVLDNDTKIDSIMMMGIEGRGANIMTEIDRMLGRCK